METRPAVLLLMTNDLQREVVRRHLMDMEVVPIAVRADRALNAIEEFRPITVVLDEAHAAMAPDDFLESTCSHHVRLLTWPDFPPAHGVGDSMLRDAVMPPPL